MFSSHYVGSIPNSVMGTAKDYCRCIKALLTPYLEATTVRGDWPACCSCAFWAMAHRDPPEVEEALPAGPK